MAPLSFIQVFSKATDAIQQGAFRRGANMGTMRIDHPDVLSFICIKEDLSQVTNYNLSCTVPDAFMEQVKADRSALHVVMSPHDKRQGYLSRATDLAARGIETFWVRRYRAGGFSPGDSFAVPRESR